ncbi:MAG: RNA pseudouridine synthase [Clostridia bacterium]|nr:RNA pseudouridine synthase [Clostridia bacterium]
MRIIFEDKNYLVVEKSPKVPVQSDRSDDIDLQTLALDYMKSKGFEEPYIGLVHRLDRPVGGIVVFAKNPRINAYLSKLLQNRQFDKYYLAVVEGTPEKQTLIHFLKKKASNNTSYVVKDHEAGSKKAILHVEPLKSFEYDNTPLSLVKIKLDTGRHHQIRVQMSYAGYPIWGDTKYNPSFQDKKGWFQIALYASEVQFRSIDGQMMTFSSEPTETPFKELLPSE